MSGSESSDVDVGLDDTEEMYMEPEPSDDNNDDVLDSDDDPSVEVEEAAAGVAEDMPVEGGPPGAGSKKRGQNQTKGKQKKDAIKVRSKIRAEVMAETGDLRNLMEIVEYAMEKVGESAKVVLPAMTGKTKEQQNVFERFKKIGMQMAESLEVLCAGPEAVIKAYEDLDLEARAQQMQDDRQFVALLEELDECATNEVEAKTKKIGVKKINKNPSYKKFIEEITKECFGDVGTNGPPRPKIHVAPMPGYSRADSDVQSRASEGLEALSEYIPTRDPITRKLLKDPYVNRYCGHVYEYESIMNLIITSGGKMKCPLPVCKNKKPVKVDDLHQDLAMAQKIAQRIREEDDD